MLKEIAGEVAGKIWNSLNEKEGQSLKELKKVIKETDKNLYLGLGWLLREGKIVAEEGKFNLK